MAELTVKEVTPVVRDLFDKGRLALQRENFDYAILWFTQALQREPGFFACRELLRTAQFKKQGGSSGFFKKVMDTAGSSPLIAKGQMLLRSNPAEALLIAEQILTSDPASAAGHRLLAEAALALEMPRSAALSLEILHKTSPKDRWAALHLGQVCGRIGLLDRGETVFAGLKRDYPRDPEIAMAYKNFTASRTMNEGGYDALADGTGSYRDILKNKAEAVTLEQEKRTVKSADVTQDLIAEYEAQLKADPENVKLRQNLAELCVERKDFDCALEHYQRIAALTGRADATLDKAIADTTIRKFDHALAQLDPQASDHADQVTNLQAERAAFILADCKRRSERYPNDQLIRFELGKLYFDAGKISEAIQEFQRAQSSPQLRIPCMSYLGQCFARRGMNDMAARKLQEALKEKTVFDDEKKELLYTLGCVLEKMGKAADAIEPFKQIYEQDIGFRDVSARVDAYYAANQS
ncbi:MAG: tetratricopeptide repeat protein [Verrucomicrobia bacterium]|nr:tetratricopeptide repeat protein [Verrucomicrobiota bacterium]